MTTSVVYHSVPHTLYLAMTAHIVTPVTFHLQLTTLVFWVLFYVLQNHPYSCRLLFLNSDSQRRLTQHITSHDPARFCSASMCVQSKYWAIVLLEMTVSISMTCVSGSWEASTLPHSIIEKNVLTQRKWSHSLIFCHHQIHHVYLSHACIVEWNANTVCRRWYGANLLAIMSTNHTKNVATIIHCIPQLYAKIALWPLPMCVFFLGSSWCTCSATSLSLQHCRRCCAKGRM